MKNSNILVLSCLKLRKLNSKALSYQYMKKSITYLYTHSYILSDKNQLDYKFNTLKEFSKEVFCSSFSACVYLYHLIELNGDNNSTPGAFVPRVFLYAKVLCT